MKKNVKKIFLGYRDTFFELKICYLAYYDNCKKYQKKNNKNLVKNVRKFQCPFSGSEILDTLLTKNSIFYKNLKL